MRIISLNANGIRAAARKGFFEWFAQQDCDILCIQETKAQEEQLSDPLFSPEGYYRYMVSAEKKGYSGVAIYTRKQPNAVHTQLGIDWADNEGRYIAVEFDHLTVASLYLPSGSSGDARQAYKMDFLNQYTPMLSDQLKANHPTIICGDFNIVHKENDIKNWKANQKTSGCLPEERAWLDHIFDEQGWVDSYRTLYPEKTQYTWWSNRGQARKNNVGWRIDYQVITPDLAPTLRSAHVFTDAWFSDHAPLVTDYAMERIEKA